MLRVANRRRYDREATGCECEAMAMRKTRIGAVRKQKQRGQAAGSREILPSKTRRTRPPGRFPAGHAECVSRQPRSDGVFNANLKERSEGEDSDE